MIVLWLPILMILTAYVISSKMSDVSKLIYYVTFGVLLALKLLFALI